MSRFSLDVVNFTTHAHNNLGKSKPGGPGEGITPYNRLYGKAPPRKGCHFRDSGIWRCTVRISIHLNYERVGKSVISVCKKAQNAKRYILWLSKSRLFTVPSVRASRSSGLRYIGGEGRFVNSLVKKSRICSSFVVILQLLKGIQSFKLDRYVKKVPFVNRR